MVLCLFKRPRYSHATLFLVPPSKQVRNAQRVGAAGVLIADNTCLCSATECISDLPCEANEPIMADDGSGADVSIPSMLVYKPDADLFKKELMANHPMNIEMIWSIPTPDDRVEYDLWTVPSDTTSKDFLMTFKRIAIALDQHAYFTPHMYIYDGARSGCIGQGNANGCDSLCTNNGRYCATDPDGDLNAGVSGADVVRESLRRLCIAEHYIRKNGVGVEWWNYVEEFELRCNTPELFANPPCIDSAFKAAGVDGDRIFRCMKDSGGVEQDVPNNKLDLEISNQNARGVVVIPTAYVNEVALHGALTSENVFAAICAGFADGSTPKLCSQCARCPNPIDCVETGFCTNGWEHHVIHKIGEHTVNSISTGTFFTTIILSMGFVAAMVSWYHNRSQIRMQDQMRGLLAQYMPLDDNEDDLGNPMEYTHTHATSPLVSSPEPQQQYHEPEHTI